MGYIDNFYNNIDREGFHTKILMLNYTVENLEPETMYEFYVTSVNAQGVESVPSRKITASTTMIPEIFNILDFGAIPDDDIKDTKAIQDAIDACTPGGKVVIPEGKFISGEIWLKSDMTLEINGYLLGSPDAHDYSMGFWLYDYSTDERSYSLINAHTYDYGSLKNIRIVGSGIVDGNGWKQRSTPYIIDEAGNPLPQYEAGNNTRVTGSLPTVLEGGILSPLDLESSNTLGILAANQSYDAQVKGMNQSSAYATRSNLITVRGVNGMYYEGITQLNPSFHGIVNLHCENVVVNGTIAKTYDANNADGLEFGDSRNIMVFNNYNDTGDDAFNFASGMGQAASYSKPTGDAWIFNNYIREGHGGVIAGSHTGGWIQNFLVEDNIMYKTDVGLRCKTNTPMGGGARNFLFRDNALEGIDGDGPFVFTSAYSDANAAIVYEPAQVISQFRDIEVVNTTVRNQGGSNRRAIYVVGNNNAGEVYHENINFRNVKFDNVFAVNISYGKDMTFENVTFTNVKNNNGNPWIITNSSGMVFKNTTMSATSINAASAPEWLEGTNIIAQSSEDGTRVTLSWSGATDDTGVTGYTIYKNGEQLNSNYTTTSSRTYTVTGLAPATEYVFKVEATDTTGNRTGDGPEVVITTLGGADVVPPTLPSDTSIVEATSTIPANITFNKQAVDVTYSGYTWLSIEWKAASDEYGIAGYNVYTDGKHAGFATSNKFTLTQLEPGTSYSIEVEAVDTSGNTKSYESSIELSTQPAYAIGAPNFTDILEAKALSDGKSVQLDWSAPTAMNQEIIGYRVYVNGKPIKEEGVIFTPINNAMTTTETTFTVTGLEIGKEYTFKVEACGAATKLSKRERLAHIYPNGLVTVKGYRWSGFGPSITINTAAGVAEDFNNKTYSIDVGQTIYIYGEFKFGKVGYVEVKGKDGEIVSAVVENDFIIVTGLKEGKAKVTAYTRDGKHSQPIQFDVK